MNIYAASRPASRAVRSAGRSVGPTVLQQLGVGLSRHATIKQASRNATLCDGLPQAKFLFGVCRLIMSVWQMILHIYKMIINIKR